MEGVSSTLRPYWEESLGDNASVVQAQPDILEIVPPGSSKGSGVKILLDHLGVSPKEVSAIELFPLSLLLPNISKQLN